MVDMLTEIDSELYQPYVTYKGKSKVLYVHILKAIYRMLKSEFLFYKKLRKDLELIGFVVNPYDPCMANCMVNGKQQTVVWHIDDLKSSHMDPKVNN